MSNPTATLTHAVWTDLVAEGRDDARAEVFRHRDRQAAAYALWIAQLKDVSSLPLAEAVMRLRGAREGRLRTMWPDDVDLLSGNIELWARAAAQTPGADSARLRAYAT